MVAAISHIPHLMAAALVNHAVKHGDLDLAAGGFRDTTRVASGSPDLWVEILLANRDAVGDQLDHLLRDLQDLRLALKNPNEAKGISHTGPTPGHELSKSVLFEALKAAHEARSLLSAKRPKRK